VPDPFVKQCNDRSSATVTRELALRLISTIEPAGIWSGTYTALPRGRSRDVGQRLAVQAPHDVKPSGRGPGSGLRNSCWSGSWNSLRHLARSPSVMTNVVSGAVANRASTLRICSSGIDRRVYEFTLCTDL
jgi:hypothetical protein